MGLLGEVLSGEGIDVRGGQEEWDGEGKACVLFCRLLCPSLSPPASLFCTQGPPCPHGSLCTPASFFQNTASMPIYCSTSSEVNCISFV